MVLADSDRISPVPPYSGYCSVYINFRIQGYHLMLLTFPGNSTNLYKSVIAVLQPQACRNNLGLGSFPFARHYLGNHCYFLFLRLLRCFSSAGLPPFKDIPSSTGWVAPFGYLRINSYWHFPVAFRSLLRPSSPLRA